MRYVLYENLSEINANNCGIAILKPGWTHPSRTLPSSVLIFGKKGQVEISVERNTLTVDPGGFVILPAERNHEGAASLGAPASYLWMHFFSDTPRVLDEDEAFRAYRAEGRLDNAILLPQQFRPTDERLFGDMFHDILFEQEHPSFTRHKMQLLFRLMLVKLNESAIAQLYGDDISSTQFSLMYAVIKVIHENFTDTDFSVKKLSSIMNYNSDYLSRLFKIGMGKSLGDYIADQRIKYAACALEETNETVGAIAYDSGFNSLRNFIRQFKARKGETPTELRSRHRTMHVTNR